MRPTESLDCAEAFANDRTAPAKARAEVADWLARHRNATDLVASLSTMRSAAQSQLVEARATAPGLLVAALAAGPVDPETIAPDLSALAYEVDLLGERHTIATRALTACYERVTRGAFIAHRSDLVRWIAERRVEVPWHGMVAGHVALAWSAIGSRFRVQLPYEAVVPEGEERAMTPTPMRSLDLDLPSWSGRERLAIDRAWFAWSAIAEGSFRTYEEERAPTTLLLAKPWHERQALPARQTPETVARRGLLATAR